MAQPSVARYFAATRKRPAVEDIKFNQAKKVLILESEPTSNEAPSNVRPAPAAQKLVRETTPKVIDAKVAQRTTERKKLIGKARTKNAVKTCSNDIKALLENMGGSQRAATPPPPVESLPQASTSKNSGKELGLEQIKKKITSPTNARAEALRASIDRFRELSKKLDKAEEKSKELVAVAKEAASPKLKTFKAIELEVNLSPQKAQLSPEKAYLSPYKKDLQLARRNLFTSPQKVTTLPVATSPSKRRLFQEEVQSEKPGLTLPHKYRVFAQVFDAVDKVALILHNRGEVITFQKLKPAVEKMLHKNFTEKHLAQIRHIFPEAYNYAYEKLKDRESRAEKWELVLTFPYQPDKDDKRIGTSDILKRQSYVYKALQEKVKTYHEEFLQNGLAQPMVIARDKITHWHPEFDLEKVPDVELGNLPPPPIEETMSSGRVVLEKAREMFGCNTKMQLALNKLMEKRDKDKDSPDALTTPAERPSVLKGIPTGLLEKVRQKQAAKALVSMTRSNDKFSEVEMYSRLPELARFTRSVFVDAKKNVLHIDFVRKKLEDSCLSFTLSKIDMERYLKTIEKEVPSLMVFKNERATVFIHLNKETDISAVIRRLEALAEKKKNE